MYTESMTPDCRSLSSPSPHLRPSLHPRRRRRRVRTLQHPLSSSREINDISGAGHSENKNTSAAVLSFTNINDWYRCPLCKYKVRRRAVFQIHIFSHREDFLRGNFKPTYFENGVEAGKHNFHSLPHSAGKLLYCPKCDYKTNRKFNLESHLLRHSKSKVAKCPNCHYKTINKRFFNIHQRNCKIKKVKNSHEEKKESKNTSLVVHSSPNLKTLLKDTECDFVTMKHSTTQRQLLEQIDVKPLNATTMKHPILESLLFDRNEEKPSTLKDDLLEDFDVPLNSPLKSQLLEYSDDPFNITEKHSILKSRLLEHSDVSLNSTKTQSSSKSYLLEEEHSDVNVNLVQNRPSLKDKIIEYSEIKPLNKAQSPLKNHLSEQVDIKQFKCSKCSYMFNEKCQLKAHLRTHKTPKFGCSECEFVTNRNSSLKKHKKEHFAEKQFKCRECSYQTNEKGNFKNHMLIHSTDVYKCPDCSYECNVERYLKIHSVVHLPEEEYLKCSKCSYKTPRKTELKIHSLKHSSIKMFKCPEQECDFKTNRKNSLKIHALSHSDTKLFECDNCSYATNQRSNLKIHLLNHLKMKLFKCSHCNYETNHASHFKRHYLKHC